MINVIRGADKAVTFTFRGDSDFLDGMTEMTIALPASTTIRKVYTTAGIIKVSDTVATISLTNAETELMALGLGQGPIEIVIDWSTTRKIYKVYGQLNVSALELPS